MKNLKKIAALVIVLAMALSTVAFGAAFTDVAEDASYNEAVEVMSALGLLKGYEDGTFGPDKTITRAEFAAVVVRMLGMEDAAAGAAVNTIFSDVTAAHWGSGYVQVANQQGIIAGYGDGTFGPDDEVTYEQAVKMIVCALGYDKMFENVPNAYPAGYISQANVLGITVGAVGRIGDNATRAIVAKLAYNALDTKLMEQTVFGSDNNWTSVSDTLLSKNLKIAKVEDAILVQVNFDPEKVNKVGIGIDAMANVYAKEMGLADGNGKFDSANYGYTANSYVKELYFAEGVSLEPGYSSVAYIDLNGYAEDWKVLAIVPKTGKNKVLTLTGDQTEKGNLDLATDKAEYYKTSYENDDDVIITFDAAAQYFVNKDAAGTALDSTFETAWEAGSFGEIKLIDRNADNKYDSVYISDYESFIVSEIKEKTFKVKGTNGYNSASIAGALDSITLDPEATGYTFDIKDAEGKELALADIKIGDVVNVKTSTDANTFTYYEVIVTNNKITATIAEETTTGKFVIDGVEYDAKSSLNLAAGKAGVFTLDANNYIVAFAVDNTNVNYGVIYKLYAEQEYTGADWVPHAIIYTADGSFVDYKFAKNAYFKSDVEDDTVAVKDIGNAFKATSPVTTYIDASNIEGLVLYAVNSNNEIKQLYWTDTGVNAAVGTYKVDTDSAVSYRPSMNKLGSYYVSESTLVVGNVDPNYSSLDKEDLSIKSIGLFNDTQTYDYDLIYDKDTKEIKAIVVKNCVPTVPHETLPMIVTGASESVDEEDNKTIVLKGYVDEEATTVTVTNDTWVYDIDAPTTRITSMSTLQTQLDRGALIQVVGEGVADTIRIIATAAEVMAGSGYASLKNAAATCAHSPSCVLDEGNDTTGFLWAGQLNDVDGVDIKLDANHTIVYDGPVTYIDLVKDTMNATKYDLSDAETATENITSNDDYVIIYKYDDESLAAIIIDVAGDTL